MVIEEERENGTYLYKGTDSHPLAAYSDGSYLHEGTHYRPVLISLTKTMTKNIR